MFLTWLICGLYRDVTRRPPLSNKLFDCMLTVFVGFSGRSQHSTESAPGHLSYRGRGTRRPCYCRCILFCCFPRRSRRRTNSAPRPSQVTEVGGQQGHATSVLSDFCFPRRSQRRTNSAARPLSYEARVRRRQFVYSCMFFASEDAADTGQTQHQGP